MKKAIIVLPTYNERNNVREVLPQIFSEIEKIKDWNVEVLVADDNSPDGTYDEVVLLQKKYPKVLHVIQGNKEGLGEAYIRAFRYAIKNLEPDVLFEMDADGQHPPRLIAEFLKAIDDGADFVIGSRYIKGGSIPDSWTIDRKFYSIVGSLVARIGFMHPSIHDWTSGFRAIKSTFLKTVLDEMGKYNGYVFQIALLDKAIKKHLHISEIPLQFTDRADGSSKFKSIEFILDSSFYVLFNSSFIKFVVVGFIGAAIDFGIAALLITKAHLFKPHANALSAEVAIISNFFMNNFWSFKHKKIAGGLRAMLSSFLTFNVVSSGSIVIQWLGMLLALHFLGDTVIPILSIHTPSWVIYKVFIIAFLIIPYSYFMYNKVIWKPSHGA